MYRGTSCRNVEVVFQNHVKSEVRQESEASPTEHALRAVMEARALHDTYLHYHTYVILA